MANERTSDDTLSIVAQVVSAHVSNNNLRPPDLAGLIDGIHTAFTNLGGTPTPEPSAASPAVSVKKSVKADHLVCLEDGKAFKSLKRHLATAHGLTPTEYRQKWNLAATYPMVAATYSEARPAMAKANGPGRPKARKPKRAKPRKV